MSARSPIRPFTGSAVVFPHDDVDTDRIVPARFLKITDRSDLADALFADQRTGADGRVRADSPFDAPGARAAAVLIAGRNFGCGSSREHAVWALQAFGFRAVVAPSFADIFRANALVNGLLPLAFPATVVDRAVALARDTAGAAFAVDLEAQTLKLPDGSAHRFELDAFARRRLLAGTDTLDALLAALPDIERFDARHVVLVNTIPEAG